MGDRRVTSRINMFNTFLAVCATNLAGLGKIPILLIKLEVLKKAVAEIKALKKRLPVTKSGDSDAKTAYKLELSLLLGALCGAGKSYAKDLKDLQLWVKFNLPESTFVNMRDTDLIETTDYLVALQADYAEPLVNYGVDEGYMVKIETALSNFDDTNPLPSAGVSQDKAVRETLLKKTFETTDYLYNDFMEAAKMLKVTDFELFSSLENASLIKDTGLRHNEMDAEAIAAKEQKKLDAKAKRHAAKLAKIQAAELRKQAEAAQKLEMEVAKMTSNGQAEETTQLLSPEESSAEASKSVEGSNGEVKV